MIRKQIRRVRHGLKTETTMGNLYMVTGGSLVAGAFIGATTQTAGYALGALVPYISTGILVSWWKGRQLQDGELDQAQATTPGYRMGYWRDTNGQVLSRDELLQHLERHGFSIEEPGKIRTGKPLAAMLNQGAIEQSSDKDFQDYWAGPEEVKDIAQEAIENDIVDQDMSRADMHTAIHEHFDVNRSQATDVVGQVTARWEEGGNQ